MKLIYLLAAILIAASYSLVAHAETGAEECEARAMFSIDDLVAQNPTNISINCKRQKKGLFLMQVDQECKNNASKQIFVRALVQGPRLNRSCLVFRSQTGSVAECPLDVSELGNVVLNSEREFRAAKKALVALCKNFLLP